MSNETIQTEQEQKFAELKFLHEKCMDNDPDFAYYDKVKVFSRGLFARHGQSCNLCLLYHALGFSSPNPALADQMFLDFPAPDSIEAFIRQNASHLG